MENISWNQKEIEKKWQNRSDGVYRSLFDCKKKKHFYVLEMFPYPSGQIHMGHFRNYTIGDVFARYKYLQGESVIHPFGWDSFGLPAENAANESNISARDWTENNISSMEEELQRLGFSWEKDFRIHTHSEEYYKEQQKIFIYLYEKNLIYKRKSCVFWDPYDKTVLANEQVIDGKGWRSKKPVKIVEMDQWFCRISFFARNLLKGIEALHGKWPKKVLDMQKNWIGARSGYNVQFSTKDQKIDVFVEDKKILKSYNSCIEITYNHPLIEKLTPDMKEKVLSCTIANRNHSENHRVNLLQKAIHPILDCVIPIFFSNKINLYNENGIAILKCMDSKNINFSPSNLSDLQKRIYEKIISQKKITRYRLKDWCISRQRHWGCPIPLIDCPKCGLLTDKTGVVLPNENNRFYWKEILCPTCGADATREEDTMDTFFDSSWYYIAYLKKMEKRYNLTIPFKGVDFYVGGIEHAILHLMYSRFLCRALNGTSYANILEPFSRLFTQGMICHKTFKGSDNTYLFPHETYEKEGNIFSKKDHCPVKVGPAEKMSKSLKNVVLPSRITQIYGVDITRLYILSDTPCEKDFQWSQENIVSSQGIIKRVTALSKFYKKYKNHSLCIEEYIYKINICMEKCEFNVVISYIFQIIRKIENFTQSKKFPRESFHKLLIVLYPFIPHSVLELWERIEYKKEISNIWPIQENYRKDTVSIAVQINGKTKKILHEMQHNLDEKNILDLCYSDKKLSFLSEFEIKKIIYIPNKIINFLI